VGTTSGVRLAVPLLTEMVFLFMTSVDIMPPYWAYAAAVRGVAWMVRVMLWV